MIIFTYLKTSVCIFVFISLTFNSFGQNSQSNILIENHLFISLIDSISNPAIVLTKANKKSWTPPFIFIDSLSLYRIKYFSDGLKVNGFIVKPKKAGLYPCIIWNRGGVEEFGTITTLQAAAMMGKLASKGYVVIASQYRGNGGSEGKEEYGGQDINDVLNLIDVLSQITYADTSRIGVFGGSRGGMMTYQALTKSDKFKAAAVLGAPSDESASIKDRPSLEKTFFRLVKNYKENKQQELDKRSAIKWVDKFPKNVPILIMHGNADWRVKSTQSLRLALELDKSRIPYRLMIFEGADHSLSEFRNEFYTTLTTWFDKYLKKSASLPQMEFHGR